MYPPASGAQCAPARRRLVSLLLVLSLLLLAVPTQFIQIFPAAHAAPSTSIVISEFRFRGPSGGNDEFVELLNVSGSTVIIGGWKLKGSNSSGTVGVRATVPAMTALGPGCRYLFTNNGSAGYSGTVAGNLNYGTGFVDDGGVAITKADDTIVDQVGLSSGSAFKEGTNLPHLGTTTASNLNRGYERKNGGALDTDSNSTDFAQRSPSDPQSAAAGCLLTATNPSAATAASPASVGGGDTTLLTVTVTPGANPASTGVAVSANLSSIGLSAAQQFLDDGLNGDAAAGDNVFSYAATIPAGTGGGSKSLPVSISDAQGRAVNSSVALTVLAPTAIAATGAASPALLQAGQTSLLTVAVTPGANPPSAGLAVTADLSPIGGAPAQQFYDDGTNGDAAAGDKVFSFGATVAPGTSAGVKNLTASVSDAQGRTATAPFSLTVDPAAVPAGSVVISQVYGGGGNSNATFTTDFVEIFNRSSETIDLTGWSLQYASAAGPSSNPPVWSNKTTLSGFIAPGQYVLISGASNNGCSSASGNVPCGAPLPVAADVVGSTNLSGTDGKVALVSNNTALTGTCPLGGRVVDFVGYGGDASCFEGDAPAPRLGNNTAAFRTRAGCKDSDFNAVNFTETAPAPRNRATGINACPAADFAPEVLSTDPASGGTNFPVASNITVKFDAAVSIADGGITVSCGASGAHTSAVTGGPTSFTVNPDSDFAPGEVCTATVLASHVTSQADPSVFMAADYTWTFGTLIVRDPAEHLVMGNPSGAAADANLPLNYLMSKPQYALSYNSDKGTPNWTSWHLDSTWTTGVADRQNDFRPDETLPAGFKRVASGFQAATYGFDRGHMTPSADRTSSVEDNSATFLMTNMVPQASGNNQGPWADMENDLRALLNGASNELYIVSGGHGVGGTSSTGTWESIVDTGGNSVTVPDLTWKVVMVMPRADGDDVARVNNSTRTFAVIMPNDDNIRPDDWRKYAATVDQVEALTGYDFFSNVGDAVEAVIESRLDGELNTAPVAGGQSLTTPEDTAQAVTLSAADANVNNTLTYTVVSGPSHGQLDGTGSALTYTPHADYHGPDSFTFKVNDGGKDSNTATVTINVAEVNDAPTARDNNLATAEDSAATAVGVLANDSDVDAGDALTVTAVTQPANGVAAVAADGADVTYTPNANFHGADSFTYTVSDGRGGTATAAVSVTVDSVNDQPVAVPDSGQTDEDTPVTIDVVGNDTDEDGEQLSLGSVSDATHGTVAVAGGRAVFTPEANFNGLASFSYSVIDGSGGLASRQVNVDVRPVNDAPTLAGVPASASVDELAAYTFTAQAADVDGQTPTFSLVGAPSGAAISPAGVFTWTPTEEQGGTGAPYSFTVRVSDGALSADAPVTVTVGEVNQAPALAEIGPKLVALGGTLAFTAAGTDADLPAQGLTYSLTGAVPQGAAIDPATGAFSWTPTLAQAGQVYNFGVRVTDGGGLSAERPVGVGVGHTWSGFLQPVNADGSSVFRLGRTVPVKFQLTGASAGVTNLAARLYVAKVTDSIVGSEEEADSTSSATEGNLFRYADGGYIFNLDTTGLSQGTYQLRVDMGDGFQRAVLVSLR